MSVELASITRTYDVKYEGKNYVLVRSLDTNIDYPDTNILCEGEEVDDETFEEVFEYFSEEVDSGNVEF